MPASKPSFRPHVGNVLNLGLGFAVNNPHTHSSPALIEAFQSMALLLCPPSIGLMALEGEKAFHIIVLVVVFICLLNSALYAVVGSLAYAVWRWLK
jgi:hypothetical protein